MELKNQLELQDSSKDNKTLEEERVTHRIFKSKLA